MWGKIVIALISHVSGVIIALIAAGFFSKTTEADLKWKAGNAPDSCQSVCSNYNMQPVESEGQAQTGNKFFLCSAGLDRRPGYNSKDNGFHCGIGSGGNDIQNATFSCLCKNF